ncbi:MAG: NAD(P)-dependent oxidoreductase, partial [Acetobacteraceae bacterium]|nr:NAD(P)-dependent oxidoreductase [Acetobacteraceae bacterium]
ISNILEEADHATIPGFSADPLLRKWNLWSWVDSRDVAQACRLALDAPERGADCFTIAGADTVMTIPNAELMARYYPSVRLVEGTGPFDTLLSIDKARRVLGYAPLHTWRVRA